MDAAADDMTETATGGSDRDVTFEDIIDESHDGFLITDDEGYVVWSSKVAGRFFGIAPEALRGARFGVPRVTSQPVTDIEIVAADGGAGAGRMTVSPVRWEGRQANLVTIRDTSISTHVSERLAHATIHDSLTGLPGRKAFEQRVREARDRALRYGGGFSVIMVIPDQIAAVSASLGYSEGEELIAQTAQRLSGCLAATDALARIDHQTFAFVNEDVADLEHAKLIANRIAAALEPSIEVGGRTLATTVSIGVVHSDGAYGSEADLLRDAHAALKRGQTHARTSIGAFSDNSAAALKRQFEFSQALRSAVSSDELTLLYQPIVTADLRSIRAVEALVRWDPGGRGTLPPGRFLPTAEAIGMSAEIDTWVLRRACAQGARWNDGNRRRLDIHVNVTAQDLLEPGFIDTAVEIVQEASIDPRRLCFELTESTLVDAQAVEGLRALRYLGCQFAIDDFGTGFSSYAHLERLTFDVLKIDRSFVTGLGANYKDGLIVNSMIALATGLNLPCIAEGVETTVQAAALRDLGCQMIQGFLVARPMTAESLDDGLDGRWS